MSVPPSVPLPRPAGYRQRVVLAHLAWEAVLLVLVLGTMVAVAIGGDLFRGPLPWHNLAGVGLLATGFALSLRTATPNLAIGALATLAGVVYARLAGNDWPGALAGLAAVLVALVVGLLLGLLVGLTSAPAWAVTLGGMAAAQAAVFALSDGRPIGTLAPGGGTGASVFWTVVFVLGSLAGALLWQVPRVRATLGANRTPTDPVRFAPSRLPGALVGVGGSSLLAGVGGVAYASYVGVAGPVDNGLFLLAVGAALLGGVSVFGSRGGFAGTVLATILLVVANLGMARAGLPRWMAFSLLAPVAILVGVVVGRLLEAVAGPEPDSSRAPDPSRATPWRPAPDPSRATP